jgi:hypothetical protein
LLVNVIVGLENFLDYKHDPRYNIILGTNKEAQKIRTNLHRAA